MKTEKKKQKNYNLELIRTISFIMVIVIHVTNYFCRAFGRVSTGEYWFALIMDTFARVSVPSFFMLSGALLLGRDEPFEKNIRRTGRFIVVLLFWSLVYCVHNRVYMGTPCSLFELLYVPAEPHLWYLYAMIPIYVVLPFFQIMCRGMNRKLDLALCGIISVVVIVMYNMSMMNVEFFYDLPLIGDKVYTFYFFLGYFLYKYRTQEHISTKVLFAIFLVSNILNIILTASVSSWTGEHYERFLEYGCPLVILSGASFFALMLRIKNGQIRLKERTEKAVDTWCTCSFGIYLIHILFLDNYKKYIEPEAVSAYLAIPALTLVILMISFGCVYLIRQLPCGTRIT